jgi:preprotein translocase SecE subunit
MTNINNTNNHNNVGIREEVRKILKGVRSELPHLETPTKKQILINIIKVLAVGIFFCLFILLCNIIVNYLLLLINYRVY